MGVCVCVRARQALGPRRAKLPLIIGMSPDLTPSNDRESLSNWCTVAKPKGKQDYKKRKPKENKHLKGHYNLNQAMCIRANSALPALAQKPPVLTWDQALARLGLD